MVLRIFKSGPADTGRLHMVNHPKPVTPNPPKPFNVLPDFMAAYHPLILDGLRARLNEGPSSFAFPKVSNLISFLNQLREKQGLHTFEDEKMDLGNLQEPKRDGDGEVPDLQYRICFLAKHELGIAFAYDGEDRLKMGTFEEVQRGIDDGNLFLARKRPLSSSPLPADMPRMPEGTRPGKGGPLSPKDKDKGQSRGFLDTVNRLLHSGGITRPDDIPITFDPKVIEERIKVLIFTEHDFRQASLTLFGCPSPSLIKAIIDNLGIDPILAHLCEAGNADSVSHYLHWIAAEQENGKKEVARILFGRAFFDSRNNNMAAGGFRNHQKAAIAIYKLLLAEEGRETVEEIFASTNEVGIGPENVRMALEDLKRRHPKIFKSYLDYFQNPATVFQPEAQEEIGGLKRKVDEHKTEIRITQEAFGQDAPAPRRGEAAANTCDALTDGSWSYDFGNLNEKEARVQSVKALCGAKEYTAACHLIFLSSTGTDSGIERIAEVLSLDYLFPPQIAGVLSQLSRPVLSREKLQGLGAKTAVVWDELVEIKFIDAYGMSLDPQARIPQLEIELNAQERVALASAIADLRQDRLEVFLVDAVDYGKLAQRREEIDMFFDGVLFSLPHLGNPRLVEIFNGMVNFSGEQRQTAYSLLREGFCNPLYEKRCEAYFSVLDALCASQYDYLTPADFIYSGRLLSEDSAPAAYEDRIRHFLKIMQDTKKLSINRLRAMLQLVALGRVEDARNYVLPEEGKGDYLKMITEVVEDPHPFISYRTLDILLSLIDYNYPESWVASLKSVEGFPPQVSRFVEYLHLISVGTGLTCSASEAEQEEGWLLLLNLQDRRLARFAVPARSHKQAEVRAAFAANIPIFFEEEEAWATARQMVKDKEASVNTAAQLAVVELYKRGPKPNIEELKGIATLSKNETAKLAAGQFLLDWYCQREDQAGLHILATDPDIPNTVRIAAGEALIALCVNAQPPNEDTLESIGRIDQFMPPECRQKAIEAFGTLFAKYHASGDLAAASRIREKVESFIPATDATEAILTEIYRLSDHIDGLVRIIINGKKNT